MTTLEEEQMRLTLTIDVVEPGDPEYGDYERKVITEFPPGLTDPEYVELRRTSRSWRLAHAVADAVAGDPELAGKQFRVRAHRDLSETQEAHLAEAASAGAGSRL